MLQILPPEAARTYRIHLAAEGLRMGSIGVLGLAEAVLRRSLGASDVETTLFVVLPASACLLAGFWGVSMEGRSKRPFFLLSAILGRLLLLVLPFVASPGWFLAAFAVSALAEPAFLIAQNSMFQSNYPAGVRARIVGRVSWMGRIWLLAGAIAGGWIVDLRPDLAHEVLAAGALAGFAGLVLYAAIPHRATAGATAPAPTSPRRLLADFVAVLRDHPSFRRYERNFFIYGVAFLSLGPITVFLLIDTFQVDYTVFNLVRFVLVQFGLMVAFPFAGRMMDRGGPYRTAGWAFGTLALYPVLLGLALHFHDTALLWVAFLAFGASLALVDLAWNLSSAHFARARDSAPFMGIHVFFVGVRGLFAPFLGLWLYRGLGYLGALAAASGLFLLASVLMWTSPDRRSEEALLTQPLAPGGVALGNLARLKSPTGGGPGTD